MITVRGFFDSIGLDFIIEQSGTIMIGSMYHRSEQVLKSLGATINLNKDGVSASACNKILHFCGHYDVYIVPVREKKDEFFHMICISKDLNNTSFLTSAQNVDDDFYQILMRQYQLPLMREWSIPILKCGIDKGYISQPYLTSVHFGSNVESNGRMIEGVSLRDAICYDISLLSESHLQEIIQELFADGSICITKIPQNPMDEHMTMDTYFAEYGHTLIKNLESKLVPLCELNGVPDTVVLNRKRLYPQQGAIVNGVIALLNKRSNYAIIAEGMGCGKSVQAAAISEGYAVRKYLNSHPKETLASVYSDIDKIRYRNIVMCPGHLVHKWKEEIEKEIPYSKVKILDDFKDLVALRNRGRERKGKEIYVMSKDFAKLTYMSRPVPYQVKKKQPVYHMRCEECGIIQKPTESCRRCSSKKLVVENYYEEFASGLVCHECGRLLYAGERNGNVAILTPKDFATPNSSNQQCPYCKSRLWEPFVKNIDQSFAQKKEKIRWKRATHYINENQKSVKSVWVLSGYEHDYFLNTGYTPLKVADKMEGLRKYSPAQFIKKYMKGYFDVAIFDEAHLYKGGATGQGNAMHALIKSSKKQLALTGTLAGGKADHLFYMLYRLDSKRMKSYGWNGVLKFAEEYGSIERTYELEEGADTYSTYVRGRQKGSPKTKPGISPRIYIDFLLDRAVFLDLSDMSQYMPEFKECVITAQLPYDLQSEYAGVLKSLKNEGRKNMAIQSKRLQFALSYPDKPFLENPVLIHPHSGEPICKVRSFEHYWNSNQLLPKEEKLIELLKSEIEEGRNCVVYAEFTASQETCVTERLKEIIEKHVKVKTAILYSSSPAPAERESWMHTQAEQGVRIFITNPRCVETGLDFCWTKNGIQYNFPTLIFYQLGYSLFTVWQASRRAYRLIQKSECRVYYMAYENTVQVSVISLIAQKQVATAAIQGKFSTEGIAAMAQGVDERVALAAALSSNDYQTGNSLQGMFDILRESSEDSEEREKETCKMLILQELIGMERYQEIDRILNPTVDDLFAELFMEFDDDESESVEMIPSKPMITVSTETRPQEVISMKRGIKNLALLFA